MAFPMQPKILEVRKGPFPDDGHVDVVTGITPAGLALPAEPGMVGRVDAGTGGLWDPGLGNLTAVGLFLWHGPNDTDVRNVQGDPAVDYMPVVSVFPAATTSGAVKCLTAHGPWELLSTAFDPADAAGLTPGTPLTSPVTGAKRGKLVPAAKTDTWCGIVSLGTVTDLQNRKVVAFHTHVRIPA